MSNLECLVHYFTDLLHGGDPGKLAECTVQGTGDSKIAKQESKKEKNAIEGLTILRASVITQYIAGANYTEILRAIPFFYLPYL